MVSEVGQNLFFFSAAAAHPSAAAASSARPLPPFPCPWRPRTSTPRRRPHRSSRRPHPPPPNRHARTLPQAPAPLFPSAPPSRYARARWPRRRPPQLRPPLLRATPGQPPCSPLRPQPPLPTLASARSSPSMLLWPPPPLTSASFRLARSLPLSRPTRVQPASSPPRLTGLLSPTRLLRQPHPRFSTTRPLAVDTTWASPAPSTDSALASAVATI
jgi:hypothetical protein